MSDQKIEEIRARVSTVAHEFALGIEGRSAFGFWAATAMPILFDELDRLKAQTLDYENQLDGLTPDGKEMVAALSKVRLEFKALEREHEIARGQVEEFWGQLATLKASGTFTDGIEAAAKAAQVSAADAAKGGAYYEGVCDGHSNAVKAIRALSPQQNAQREREIEITKYAGDASNWRNGNTLHEPIQVLDAFNNSRTALTPKSDR